MKKTVVFGASPNSSRYSYRAVENLLLKGHAVVPVGIRKGVIGGENIVLGQPEVEEVDTITLYLGAARQPEHYDYFFSLRPKRIIFNPGAENPELFQIADEKGVEVINACTLVMLSIGNY